MLRPTVFTLVLGILVIVRCSSLSPDAHNTRLIDYNHGLKF